MQSWAARSKTWQLSTTVSLDFHLQPDLKHNGFTELRRQRLELMEAMNATTEDSAPQLNKACEILKYIVSQNDAISLEFAIK